MSKRLYLICNAHLDPVWQWEWEEGAAETLSTFRIAADFCEEYDNFVFCHNEALLYKWIEEYDPQLFKKIQMLVAADKWKIMGGWHLQPDCNMPSGESFVRQIFSGRKYFLEKFGKVPTVAINVDPFGHSRGLVQIMKKSGYEGYLFTRPSKQFLDLPSDEFNWVGYDGSEITAVRISSYNSAKGKAADKIRDYIDNCEENDFTICLWGIGNHGGGPSKEDIENINALTDEVKKDNIELIQSCPEDYFKEVRKKDLPKVGFSLNPWSPGCYTSQIRIKQKHRLTENTLYLTEIMCSHASQQGLIKYPSDELAEVVYDLMTVEFHDILPGSSIQPAEEMGIRMLDHALEILSRLKAKAFFALTSGQKKSPSDKISVFAYNPYPYRLKGTFTSEFMLWDQDWNDEFMLPTVYDENGKICPSQCEKEYSTIPIEWRKRVVFNAELEPMKLNRFECAFTPIPKKPVAAVTKTDDYYIIENEKICVKISRKTGLVSFLSDGKTSYLAKNAFALEVFNDNYDPWYMESTAWKEKIGQFELVSDEEAAVFCHSESPIEAVHIIESGEVRTIVEAVFGFKTSRAIVKYTISNDLKIKVDIRIVWNEKQRLVKLNIPSDFKANECIGEQAYGREILRNDMEENVSQKYTAISSDTLSVLAVNNGIYGSSFDDTNSSLKITLLRSPSYCAHPIPDRRTMPRDRYMPHIEQGERDFGFLFVFGKKEEILDKASRIAQEFNMEPMVLSFYPTGNGTLPKSPLMLIDNDVVNISTLKKAETGDGYIIRLFNPTEKEQRATLICETDKSELIFSAFEIITVRWIDGKFEETDLMEDLI